MAALFHRSPNDYRPNVNLYCAQCESQLGIFDNEWIRLTSSYARSKEKGTHFGTEVGNRTQVVPSGAAQRSAEGCVMAEVFCRKCSNMVGQYCKSAPDAEKQPLVNQYFYKLTRTFLKDSRSNARVDPLFGYGSDIVKPSSSRSSMMPRSSVTPTSRWANTPLRQSSRTPAVSTDGPIQNLARRESQGSPMIVTDPSSNGWEASAEVHKLREDVSSQQMVLNEQSGQICSMGDRLDQQEEHMKRQDANIEEHESCLSAQAARIVEQDEVIKDHTKRFQEQQLQLSTITHQLSKLQKSMDDLKTLLLESRQNSAIELLTTSQHASTHGDIEAIVNAIRGAQNSAKELQALRVENRSMKSRLSTIASAMGTSINVLVSGAANEQESQDDVSSAAQVLGKRKRTDTGRPLSMEFGESAIRDSIAAQFSGNTEQMPTPQSSDGGQSSPMQPPHIVLNRPGNKQKGSQQRKATERRKSGAPQAKESGLLSKQNAGEVLENTTSNVDNSHPSASDNDASQNAEAIILQDPPSRARRVNSSVAAGRSKGRLSKAPDLIEVVSPDADSSMMDPADTNTRRVTRATSRAVRVEDLNVGLEILPVDAEVQVVHHAPSPLRLQEETQPHVSGGNLPRHSLPSVQEASSVLGMNLGALIASSQALTRDMNLQTAGSDNVLTMTQSLQNTPHETVYSASNTNDLDCSLPPQNEITSFGPTSSSLHIDQTPTWKNGIEIVQYSGIYDIIDTSDDEDDDLMQPDAALYGDDFYGGDDVSLPEWDITSTTNPDGASHLPPALDVTVIRQERSMAPEPIKRKKPNVSKYSNIVDMDRVYIATPQMFKEAYAAGRRPKEVRARVWTGRERDLNNELIQLGLSHWIGKSKNCKEYRDAVSAARAHFRNYNKAAYLWSKGLNHRLLDPSSALPVSQLPQPEGVSQVMPLSDIQNVPAPVPLVLNGPVSDNEYPQDEEETYKEQPRATRASTRRSSVSLVSGLEEAEIQTSGSVAKQTRSQRRSTGRKQSKRKSDMVSVNDEEADIEIDTTRPDKNTASVDPRADPDPTIVEEEVRSAGGTTSQQWKSSGRPRGRPRKSGALKSQAHDDIAQVEQGPNGFDKQNNIQPPTMPTIPRQNDATNIDTSINEKSQSESENIESRIQSQEEAILLRDRLAKELMECDELDM